MRIYVQHRSKLTHKGIKMKYICCLFAAFVICSSAFSQSMIESKYEKYIVRKAVELDASAREIFSSDLMPNAKTKIEYLYITADTTIGTGEDFPPHKHEYEEIFLFLGTDPQDTANLGAEVEFWLGQGDEREKVVINTSSAIYVAPGVVHFPQTWKNVKRPVMLMIIMPTTGESKMEPVAISDPEK